MAKKLGKINWEKIGKKTREKLIGKKLAKKPVKINWKKIGKKPVKINWKKIGKKTSEN